MLKGCGIVKVSYLLRYLTVGFIFMTGKPSADINSVKFTSRSSIEGEANYFYSKILFA